VQTIGRQRDRAAVGATVDDVRRRPERTTLQGLTRPRSTCIEGASGRYAGFWAIARASDRYKPGPAARAGVLV